MTTVRFIGSNLKSVIGVWYGSKSLSSVKTQSTYEFLHKNESSASASYGATMYSTFNSLNFWTHVKTVADVISTAFW